MGGFGGDGCGRVEIIACDKVKSGWSSDVLVVIVLREMIMQVMIQVRERMDI